MNHEITFTLQGSSREQNEPAVIFVETMINEAIHRQISDIHIEPMTGNYRIRFRCNGVLSEVHSIPMAFAGHIIARIKVLAQLDITEKRLPQDGSIHLTAPHNMSIRVSTCPTISGEKIVLRLLDYPFMTLTINNLGMTADQLKLFQQSLIQPQGLILITGPTGSGKTTTLYAALHKLNSTDKHIVTVEDPVEIRLDGITQIHVNSKIKLGFATALRALLRQDPDVIMIGEIRDHESATIAIQAAQTGHLVLSTIHGQHDTDCVNRMQMLGVSPDLLSSALILIIAQRFAFITEMDDESEPTKAVRYELTSFTATDTSLRGADHK